MALALQPSPQTLSPRPPTAHRSPQRAEPTLTGLTPLQSRSRRTGAAAEQAVPGRLIPSERNVAVAIACWVSASCQSIRAAVEPMRPVDAGVVAVAVRVAMRAGRPWSDPAAGGRTHLERVQESHPQRPTS